MTIQLITLRTSRIQSAMAIAFVLALTACRSSEREQASQMTSFSTNAAKSATPELFNIPPDQMQHVQVVTIEPTTLKRTLRLTGTVAYNAFNTTNQCST
jgi:cobalt-zinc-cadmium efflux system membrane fusion protein